CYFTRVFSFFFSSRRRHTRSKRDWSSDVCSSDLQLFFNKDWGSADNLIESFITSPSPLYCKTADAIKAISRESDLRSRTKHTPLCTWLEIEVVSINKDGSESVYILWRQITQHSIRICRLLLL